MRIVIVGCGRVGATLATDFAREGHHVSVVDQRQTAFRRLPQEFRGQLVLGTGIDEDVLRNAGIQQADVFIAVTENDNTNIMAAQIAQVIYRVPKVILRIYDPDRAEIYRELGLTVICPTRTVAEMIERAVRDQVTMAPTA
ncbi:MAG: TrkA family potassium uptake protein [Thermomicrobium sp.]|nr:TrkA family potassium uptake protein [Thermomicrobium sp.]MDW8060613.1 TrkA family potassium uptake protein [Thermomicrobium sp.]